MNSYIILGPSTELHTGIHSSFVRNPPSGIEYVSRAHEHIFEVVSTDGFDPFESSCISESVHYCTKDDDNLIGVHSSRLPVHNCLPWIVDVDCLLATLQFGQAKIVGHAKASGSNQVYCPLEEKRVHRMLGKYLEPNCIRILFHTNYAKNIAINYISDIAGNLAGDMFNAKAEVLYPTMPTIKPRISERNAVRIIYMGRYLDSKGATITREVFRKLSQIKNSQIDLIWVGAHTDSDLKYLDNVHFYNTLPRNKYLNLLQQSDIFFSPTNYESYGMAIVEAICLGLAVITSRGSGMEHIDELIKHGEGGMLVSNDLPENKKINDYVDSLLLVISRPAILKKMRWTNYLRASQGPLSINERNKKLMESYEAMRRWDVPERQLKNNRKFELVSFNSDEISKGLAQRIGKQNDRFLVYSDKS